MIGPGVFRREQQKDEIDRLPVERLEVDRPVEAREQPEQPLELGQFAVRDRDAIADRRKAQPLALRQHVEDFPLGPTRRLSRACCDLLERLLLSVTLSAGITACGATRSFNGMEPSKSRKGGLCAPPRVAMGGGR